MLTNSIFILLFTGIFTFFAPQKRTTSVWTYLLALAFIYAIMALTGQAVPSDISIIWTAMPDFSISINLNPIRAAKIAALGVMVISILSFYYNLLASDDYNTNNLNGLVSINCVLLLIALCSTNYLQLLAAVGMADVMVYSSINRYDSKRQYIYSNFFADFLLLSILAIILGQQGNINIMRLEDYSSSWHHRDYIVIMLLICTFIKSGIALFHTAYQKISPLTSNRINFIIFASTPLMGIIVLNTLHGLLNISQYSYPLLKLFSVITVLWGSLGAIFVSNINRKSAYMGMIFWGLTFSCFGWLLSFSQTRFFTFLIAAFLFNSWLVFVERPSQKLSLWHRICNFQMILTLLVVASYMLSWWQFASSNIVLATIGEGILGVVTATLMAERFNCLSPNNDRLAVKNIFLQALPIITIVILFVYFNHNILLLWPYIIATLTIWLTCFLLNPMRYFGFVCKINFIQNGDMVTTIYSTLFLAPLLAVGRLLRLMVDIVFLERTVISSIKNAIRFLIFIFRKLHANSVLSSTIFTFLGICIIFIAYYYGAAK